MVNGAKSTFIEVNGKTQLTNVKFRDNDQLMNICQRIVSEYGGQMTVRSKNNQGSDFGFSFQATELDEEAQEPSTS